MRLYGGSTETSAFTTSENLLGERIPTVWTQTTREESVVWCWTSSTRKYLVIIIIMNRFHSTKLIFNAYMQSMCTSMQILFCFRRTWRVLKIGMTVLCWTSKREWHDRARQEKSSFRGRGWGVACGRATLASGIHCESEWWLKIGVPVLERVFLGGYSSVWEFMCVCDVVEQISYASWYARSRKHTLLLHQQTKYRDLVVRG
jgi:hypothetical protein